MQPHVHENVSAVCSNEQRRAATSSSFTANSNSKSSPEQRQQKKVCTGSRRTSGNKWVMLCTYSLPGFPWCNGQRIQRLFDVRFTFFYDEMLQDGFLFLMFQVKVCDFYFLRYKNRNWFLDFSSETHQIMWTKSSSNLKTGWLLLFHPLMYYFKVLWWGGWWRWWWWCGLWNSETVKEWSSLSVLCIQSPCSYSHVLRRRLVLRWKLFGWWASVGPAWRLPSSSSTLPLHLLSILDAPLSRQPGDEGGNRLPSVQVSTGVKTKCFTSLQRYFYFPL